MKQIYIFIAHMGIGGAERVCVNLANEMTALGREVHIVVLNLENDVNTHLLSEQCVIHSLNVTRLRYAAIPMLRFIRGEKPKCILVFGSEMGIILDQLRKVHLIKMPIIERVLNNVNISYKKEDQISPIVEKYLKKQQKHLRDMDFVVAQCKAMEIMLLDRKLVSKEKVRFIYNPYSDKIVQKVEEQRQKVSQQDDVKRISFIGRLDPQKNLNDLFEAFALVIKRIPNVELHLVGDGLLVEQHKESVKMMGFSDTIIFEGMRKDIENVYANTDVVALSSEYEGMPNCLIEAIACGIPVVSYDCPIGPAEIVDDGKNGFLVPFKDIEKLADKLTEALRLTWDKEKVRETARKFNVRSIAETYLQIIDDIGGR